MVSGVGTPDAGEIALSGGRELPVTTLQVRPWQRVVEHAIPGYAMNLGRVLEGRDVPRLAPEWTRCRTTLPALLCECRRYFIETVEDGQGSRPVGYGGEIG